MDKIVPKPFGVDDSNHPLHGMYNKALDISRCFDKRSKIPKEDLDYLVKWINYCKTLVLEQVEFTTSRLWRRIRAAEAVSGYKASRCLKFSSEELRFYIELLKEEV